MSDEDVPSRSDAAPRFETLLTDLEGVVQALEGGELALEDALLSFERGMKLAKQAGEILDKAEMKVELLVAERDGSLRQQPYETHET